MAKREDFQQVVHAKRKYSTLEIIGTLVIWLAPIVMIGGVLIYNRSTLFQLKWSVHLELWVSIVLLITCFVYIKWGRRKIHEKYISDNARAEKHHPLLVLLNGIVNLMPFVLGIIAVDVLNSIGEPISLFLIVLLEIEAVGRFLLFIDSFKEEEYK